jgi:hypothetical protein
MDLVAQPQGTRQAAHPSAIQDRHKVIEQSATRGLGQRDALN